jgi:pimeloyl-ACP methyl ester carboxylesterase
MNVSRKTVQVDGSAMSVLDIGSGPAVVLGHGWLCDAEMWSSQIDALSARYRVIVPEMWGHGQSGAMPTGTKTVTDLARQHLDLLDQLDVNRAAVVGLSLGGMWGAELALLAPERVSSLVLMATSLAAEPAESREAFLAGVDDMAARRAISVDLADTFVSFFYSAGYRERQPDQVQAHRDRLLGWPSERVADSVAPVGRMIFDRRDALEDLMHISRPLLTLTGADDQALPPARVQAMANALSSRFEQISGAGHLLTYEVPGVVNDALLTFLADPAFKR